MGMGGNLRRALNGDWDDSLPWWANVIKLAMRYGLATVLAAFLVYDLVVQQRHADERALTQSQANAEVLDAVDQKMTAAQLTMHEWAVKTEARDEKQQEQIIYYLQTICIQQARDAIDRARCIKGPS